MRKINTIFFVAGILFALSTGSAAAEYHTWEQQAAHVLLLTGQNGQVITDSATYRDGLGYQAKGRQWLNNFASYLREGTLGLKGADSRRLPLTFVKTGRDTVAQTIVPAAGSAKIQADSMQGSIVAWKPNQHQMSGIVVGAPAEYSKSRTHVVVMTALRHRDGRRPEFKLRTVPRSKLQTVAPSFH